MFGDNWDMFTLFQIISLITSSIRFFMLHLPSSSFPPALSKQQEKEYFEQLKNKDKKSEAREMLIKHNLRLIAHITKKYYNSKTDPEDLISIGTIGLIKAVDSFDYSKGTKFSSYASRCIENEILMDFRSTKKTNNDCSFGDPIDQTKAENNLTIADVISDGTKLDAALEHKEDIRRLTDIVEKNIYGREKIVLSLRYGLFGARPHTQSEVAKIMGISRSYVSRIEKKTLFAIRNMFEK